MADADKSLVVRNRIRGNFDRGAEAYGRFEDETAFFRLLLDALLELGAPLAGQRVLDVGCGTGASLARLAEVVGSEGRAVGLDISLGMLREARARLGGRGVLVAGDGCRFGPFFRGQFDAVVYNAVLFLLPDAGGALASARQVLAPGGQVLVSHLQGVRLPHRGCSVPELLAARGLPAGRHALSPWEQVAEAMGRFFGGMEHRRFARPLAPRAFGAFYGQEPMSAGLLPGLPYPERRRIIEELARELETEGESAEQEWNLARAWVPDEEGQAERKAMGRDMR